jgi:hypothetical protein
VGWDVAQGIEHLLSKCKILNSKPQQGCGGKIKENDGENEFKYDIL